MRAGDGLHSLARMAEGVRRTEGLARRVEELEQDKIRLNRGHDAMAIRLTQTEQALRQTAQSLTAARDAQREAQIRVQRLERELEDGIPVGECVTVSPVAGEPDRRRLRVRGYRVTIEPDPEGVALEFTPSEEPDDDDDDD